MIPEKVAKNAGVKTAFVAQQLQTKIRFQSLAV